MTDLPNWAYKTFWTAVSAFLGALTVPAIFSMDITALESAAIAAGTVVYNALTILAREKAGQP